MLEVLQTQPKKSGSGLDACFDGATRHEIAIRYIRNNVNYLGLLGKQSWEDPGKFQQRVLLSQHIHMSQSQFGNTSENMRNYVILVEVLHNTATQQICLSISLYFTGS